MSGDTPSSPIPNAPSPSILTPLRQSRHADPHVPRSPPRLDSSGALAVPAFGAETIPINEEESAVPLSTHCRTRWSLSPEGPSPTRPPWPWCGEELLNQFGAHVYGVLPGTPGGQRRVVSIDRHALGGIATRKLVRIPY